MFVSAARKVEAAPFSCNGLSGTYRVYLHKSGVLGGFVQKFGVQISKKNAEKLRKMYQNRPKSAVFWRCLTKNHQ